MGDSGLRDKPLGLVFDKIKAGNYSFILDMGDQARKLMTSNFELLLQTNNRFIGDLPFYSVPGNHDVVYGDSNKPEDYLRFYNRAFGQAYYWFSFGDTLFIGLDTSRGNIYPQQELWLKSALKHLRKSFKNCIVYMHIPPIDPRKGQYYCLSENESSKLKQIFKGYNITAIFAGHIHKVLKSTFDGIPLYIAPPAGQKMRSGQKDYGYLSCEISKNNKLKVSYVPVTNDIGRDHFAAFISTEIQRIPTFQTGLICIILSWVLLFGIRKFRK